MSNNHIPPGAAEPSATNQVVEISVVIPLFNEAENVTPLVARVAEAFKTQASQIELVLVDDCSTDETWVRILKAAERDLRVRPVRHPKNRGQSAALWTGFRASRGAIIATLDGDLQNDPADLPRMLTELRTCDMVCGVRTKRADTWVRRISSRIARWARRLALRVDFADTGCNLRVFRRNVLEALPAFDGIHRFMPILAQNGGATVKEMPVCHHPRTAGVSKYGLWNRLPRGIRDLLMVGLYIRRQLKVLGSTEAAVPHEALSLHDQKKTPQANPKRETRTLNLAEPEPKKRVISNQSPVPDE